MTVRAVHVPESAETAAALVAAGGRVMGGGTVVMPLVNNGGAIEPELVSLRRAGLDAIRVSEGTAGIGAATTLSAIEAHPALGFLRPAVRSIASPAVRNLATVGGNLFVAQPYGDLAVCLLALDATCEIAGPGGLRVAAVADVLTAGIAAGELVQAVQVPLPGGGTWYYHKAMRRRLNSASIVTVAAVAVLASGVVASVRIALGGVAPRPVRAAAAERALVGRPLTHDVLDEAGRAARTDIEPFDDAYASVWYRTRVLPVHLRRAFLGPD